MLQSVRPHPASCHVDRLLLCAPLCDLLVFPDQAARTQALETDVAAYLAEIEPGTAVTAPAAGGSAAVTSGAAVPSPGQFLINLLRTARKGSWAYRLSGPSPQHFHCFGTCSVEPLTSRLSQPGHDVHSLCLHTQCGAWLGAGVSEAPGSWSRACCILRQPEPSLDAEGLMYGIELELRSSSSQTARRP